jgi:uncharacterized Ntn-hydrolase superfamily protein
MTYSLIARDPATGDFGVVVQTRYFAVGRDVPWARPQSGQWRRNPSPRPPTARVGWR